jgi:hypothetical protein
MTKGSEKTEHFYCLGDNSPGLPDGLFSNQKYQFGQILQGLRLENVYIFYDHSEYVLDTWDIL